MMLSTRDAFHTNRNVIYMCSLACIIQHAECCTSLEFQCVIVQHACVLLATGTDKCSRQYESQPSLLNLPLYSRHISSAD